MQCARKIFNQEIEALKLEVGEDAAYLNDPRAFSFGYWKGNAERFANGRISHASFRL